MLCWNIIISKTPTLMLIDYKIPYRRAHDWPSDCLGRVREQKYLTYKWENNYYINEECWKSSS